MPATSVFVPLVGSTTGGEMDADGVRVVLVDAEGEGVMLAVA